MHRMTLSAAALLLLTACEQPRDEATADGTAPPPIEPTLAQLRAQDCDAFGTPTVVRYHSRLDARTQHSVHLLNPGDTAMRAAGCDQTMPVASVVTLRYRVAGS